MTTRYSETNRLPAWQYCADLDAREALERIEADKARSFTTHRFIGESVVAWRQRIGLAVEPVTKPKIAGSLLRIAWLLACAGVGAVFAYYF